MNSNDVLRLFCLSAVFAASAHVSAFEATGNESDQHVASPRKKGEVVVTFDSMPTRMSFDMPGHIKMITENGIPYINGATETYIPKEGFHEGASYESWNDTQNEHSRMWIESANDARIVVRHRCALMKKVDGKTKIVHSDKKKVAPYGPGNWTDEWYVFHPDGTHIRRIKIWNAVARDSGAHGRKWPYELEGAYLWWGRSPNGTKVSDHLEDGFITLVKMDGTHKTINVNPYPLKQGQYAKMGRAYGKFHNANIEVFNTKSQYRPWRMGRPDPTCSMTPYMPVHPMSQLVPSFPANSGSKGSYSVAGLGQMGYQNFWILEDDSMNEVWLNGWTSNKTPAKELADIANSWWNAPKLSLLKRNGAKTEGFNVGENAYLLNVSAAKGAYLKLAASSKSPSVNPMFLINNWGSDKPKLLLDGKKRKKGDTFRYGHYKTLKMQDGNEWNDALAVWIENKATKKTQITIISTKGGTVAATTPSKPREFRTWTAANGSKLEAKLISTYGTSVTLQTKAGKKDENQSLSSLHRRQSIPKNDEIVTISELGLRRNIAGPAPTTSAL